MSKMENNTVNKAGSTGVELNLNDGTQRYQVTKKDLKKTADRYNFMACNIFNYESQMGPAVAWAMTPVLRKIYKKDEEYKEALNNHPGCDTGDRREGRHRGERDSTVVKDQSDGTVCRSW